MPPVTLDCAGSLRIDVGMILQLEPRGRIRTKRMVDPPARMEHGHQPFCSFGLQAPNLTQLFNRMNPSQRISKPANTGRPSRTEVRHCLKRSTISSIQVEDPLLALWGLLLGMTRLLRCARAVSIGRIRTHRLQ